jgi:hypothetical protein
MLAGQAHDLEALVARFDLADGLAASPRPTASVPVPAPSRPAPSAMRAIAPAARPAPPAAARSAPTVRPPAALLTNGHTPPNGHGRDDGFEEF